MNEPLLAPAAQDHRLGQVVQSYKIVRKLGEGGMGAVYEGEHTVIKRKVAIKCLHAQYATSQEMVSRFHREAMAANAIRHPNIVEVTDMGRFDDGGVFMVLEFLEGRELSSLLSKGGAQPLSRVVHVISQVCDALTAAHAQNIVHRDLKPDNIFLLPRGDDGDFVKVLDFGIAKFKESGGQGMTRTGLTMGTPHYMAPEQAQASKDLDHRADIYALGVILFHMITGVLPFDDESFPMLMVKVVTHAPPKLRALVPGIPEPIEALVDRMLAKDPTLRPASCAEVKAALAPYRGVSQAFGATGPIPTHAAAATPMPFGTPPSAPMMTPQPVPVSGVHEAAPRPSKLPLIAGAAAVLFVGLVVAVGSYFAFGRSPDDTPPPVTRPDPQPPDVPEDVPETPPADPVRASDPEPTPDPPPRADPPPAALVRVQIQTVPDSAELFLDGHRIANPFDADLPQTSEPRRLEARLEGYRTVVQDLSLVYAQRITVRLSRGRGVDDQRASRRPGGEREGSTTAPPTGVTGGDPPGPTPPADPPRDSNPPGGGTPPRDPGPSGTPGGFIPVEL